MYYTFHLARELNILSKTECFPIAGRGASGGFLKDFLFSYSSKIDFNLKLISFFFFLSFVHSFMCFISSEEGLSELLDFNGSLFLGI